MDHPVDDAFFWEVAEPLLAAGTDRSTMMGFPCLRIDGTGHAFAPNGRRFKEWVEISERDEELWVTLTHEALEFVTP